MPNGWPCPWPSSIISPSRRGSVWRAGVSSSKDLHYSPPASKVHTKNGAPFAAEQCLTGLCFPRVHSGLCAHRLVLPRGSGDKGWVPPAIRTELSSHCQYPKARLLCRGVSSDPLLSMTGECGQQGWKSQQPLPPLPHIPNLELSSYPSRQGHRQTRGCGPHNTDMKKKPITQPGGTARLASLGLGLTSVWASPLSLPSALVQANAGARSPRITTVGKKAHLIGQAFQDGGLKH